MGGGAGPRASVAPLGALAALIALAGVGVLIAQPSTAASPALLEVTEPAVRVQREGREEFSAARSGDAVTEGAVIRTDRTGVAAVAYEDGSLTRIGPATTYELVTLRTEEGRREIVGKLDTGQTFHRVSKVTGSASRFEVQTLDAVGAVRGTAFAVQCPVRDVCEFAVTEGTVTVRTQDGREVNVTAGHRVTVDGDELGELELLSEIDPWIAQNTAGSASAAPTSTAPATTAPGSAGGATTIGSSGGPARPTTNSSGGTTTTTTDDRGTTPASEPTTTTTTAPCPQGQEHVEGRGCRPECPHDRPREPNGNCRRGLRQAIRAIWPAARI